MFMLGSEPVKVFAAEPADDDRIIVSVKASAACRPCILHRASTGLKRSRQRLFAGHARQNPPRPLVCVCFVAS
jgi:hypothetical protein